MRIATVSPNYGAAVTRAKAILKPGDKVRVRTCGDGHGTYTFDRWDENLPDFFISKSGYDELHPYNVTHVNGKPVCFRDPEPTGGTA